MRLKFSYVGLCFVVELFLACAHFVGVFLYFSQELYPVYRHPCGVILLV
jgi:hypothetical protein